MILTWLFFFQSSEKEDFLSGQGGFQIMVYILFFSVDLNLLNLFPHLVESVRLSRYKP